MEAAGVVVIVVGIGIVIWGAFGFKTREEEKHDVPYGPIAGALKCD